MRRGMYLTVATVLGLSIRTPVDAQVPGPLGELARYTTIIPTHDDVARTVGLLPLARVKLAEGWQEIRLWVTGPGPVLKSRLVRVVRGPGSVSGEVYQWWSGPGPDERTCRSGQLRNVFIAGPDSARVPMGITVCRLPAPDLDWDETARRLHELGVWDLPSMQQLHWGADGLLSVTKGVDGTGITGETLDGDRYHAFYWWGAESVDGPSAAAAHEIVERVFELERIALSRAR